MSPTRSTSASARPIWLPTTIVAPRIARVGFAINFRSNALDRWRRAAAPPRAFTVKASHHAHRTLLVVLAAALGAAAGCSSPSAKAQTPPPKRRPSRSSASGRRATPRSAGHDQGLVGRAEEGVRLHRRAHRRSRREPAEVDSPAEHLQQRRGHSRIGRDGEGLLRAARLPGPRGSTTSASPSGARRATRWSTRSATTARRGRSRSTGSTTRCRSPSPTRGRQPPFEGKLVEQAPYKKVLIGRGADQLQGAGDRATGTR